MLDHLIGVEAYERLSKELCASLVQAAGAHSMQDAAKNPGIAVSRQTVDNKVLALKEVVVGAKREMETPKQLHVFADEDHVSSKWAQHDRTACDGNRRHRYGAAAA